MLRQWQGYVKYILAEAVQKKKKKKGFYSYRNGPLIVMERLYLYCAKPTKKLPQTGTNFCCFKNITIKNKSEQEMIPLKSILHTEKHFSYVLHK